MDSINITINSSIKGILGKLTKRILILLLLFVCFIVFQNIKSNAAKVAGLKIATDYSINNLLDNPVQAAIMLMVVIANFVLFVIAVTIIYKIINLFYETSKKLTFEYDNGKIITESHFPPFQRLIEENKFTEIIEVEVYQNAIDKYLNTGNIYIEFVACNAIDSQLRYVEINFVEDPFKIKDKLI